MATALEEEVVAIIAGLLRDELTSPGFAARARAKGRAVGAPSRLVDAALGRWAAMLSRREAGEPLSIRTPPSDQKDPSS